MVVYHGNYKKSEKEQRLVEVFPLIFKEDFIEGIDLEKLDDKEKYEFIQLVNKYEENLKPYIQKAYRKFLTSKFSNKVETKIY